MLPGHIDLDFSKKAQTLIDFVLSLRFPKLRDLGIPFL